MQYTYYIERKLSSNENKVGARRNQILKNQVENDTTILSHYPYIHLVPFCQLYLVFVSWVEKGICLVYIQKDVD